MVSLVVPCFDEEETIDIFYTEVNKVCQDAPFTIEFVFVDDGSKDGTLKILRRLSREDDRVHYVSFSRNFGKEAALYAGLQHSKGEYVVTMDVDLQDPPYLLPEMYRIITTQECDCVAAFRESREGEPAVRSFFAKLFYWLINRISQTKIVEGARDYRFMKRKMVDAVLNDREYNRFSKGLYSWVGFETKWLSYPNIERSAGMTKWSFLKLFKYSVEGILAYSTVPLSFVSCLGLLFCFVAFLGLCVVVGRALIFGDPVAGWPSLVSIIVFLGGIQLLCLGIVGLYVSKIYLETKGRQIYIEKETDLDIRTNSDDACVE